MSDFERYVGADFVIDTNRINARGKEPNMVQLEQWRGAGVIGLVISKEASEEAAIGCNARREKARDYITTHNRVRTPDEIVWLKKIETILFPKGAQKQKDKNDVAVVFNAYKYADILITNEGDSKRQPNGMLGSRDELKKICGGPIIMRDREAVAFVREKIRVRDEQSRLVATLRGVPVPEWIGKD